MLPHVARLRADLELNADAGVEVHAVECAFQRFLGRRQAIAPRAVGSGEDERQTGGAVPEIMQRLRVSARCIGMIHPLHELPGAACGTRGNGGRIAGTLVDRIDPQPVVGLAHQLIEWSTLENPVGQLPPVIASGRGEISR